MGSVSALGAWGLCFLVAVGSVGPLVPWAGAEEAPYSVESWPQKLGNHRALVEVSGNTDAVRARIPWRRRDAEPEKKNIVVIDRATGERIRNLARIAVNRELGDIVFQPKTVPGVYEVYYMPYTHSGPPHQFRTDYAPIDPGAVEAAWLARNLQTPAAIPAPALEALPEARVVAIQARTEFDRRDPMEIVATEAETRALLDRLSGQALLLFPEDRQFPVRMTTDLPKRWVETGPGTAFHGQAARNEFYVFQVGVYAAAGDVEIDGVSFQALRAETGGEIPATAFRCINTGGRDWLGRAFQQKVAVRQGTVQALWFGLEVPPDAIPGTYTGQLTIQTADASAYPVDLTIDIGDEVLEDCGDGELWRQSRLRWLDSAIGIDDGVVAPYTPLEVDGRTVRCLGRAVRFSEQGLPESIVCGEREILAEPIRLRAETREATTPWALGESQALILKETPGAVEWEAVREGTPLRSRCFARMEFDGYMNFRITIEATEMMYVDDFRLEIPLRRDVATYMMGMGRKGGYRPEQWDWKWDVSRANNSLWIGDVAAGLHCKLKDEQDSWNLYTLHDPGLPESWANQGQGGCAVREVGAAQVLISAYTGPRLLHKGDGLSFCFGLLPTPVKPLDPRHWSWRYLHRYAAVPEAAGTEANIINIHHGNELNPYINYPFLTVDKLGEYVRQAHENGLKVKIYYTVRELSNHVAELWALRSLGTEIFTDGAGGGYSWLREHLVDHYAAAWHEANLPNGDIDGAIGTTGLSRWHNYYLEGLAWLLRNARIDGLYLDGIGYNREIMKRVRKVMEQTRPGSLIDFHSGNNFHPEYGLSNCANQYMEHFPYIDSLWFGEGFDYNESPDYWLVEISGIPYGLFGEMLQGGGNPWRGMLYGMTNRLGWEGDPRSIWRLWDVFGIEDATMLGYWDPACPIKTGRSDILATAYVKPGKTLVAVASWATEPVECALIVDWDSLGVDKETATYTAPALEGLQEERRFAPDEPIPIEPGRGWLLVLQ